MSKSLTLHDQLYRPSQIKRGRRRKITQAAKDSLLHYLDHHPYLYQGEFALFLEEEFDIYVSRQIVGRLLKEWRISRKKD